MNVLMGLIILLAALWLAVKYRPCRRESLLCLLVCVLTGVIAIVSAVPSSVFVGVSSLLLQITVLGCFRQEARMEYKARKAKVYTPQVRLALVRTEGETEEESGLAVG